LPGVGPKSAQRLAFHLLQVDIADAERLADAIRAVKQKVQFCRRCFNVSEFEECRFCRDARRDPTVL
jgi:recombination protein RecR